jgi:hypothetical protein
MSLRSSPHDTEKLKEGKLDLGQRESVYVHQKKGAPVLTLQLLDETLIEKHNGQTYTVMTRHCVCERRRDSLSTSLFPAVQGEGDVGRLRVDDPTSILSV